MKSSFTSFMVAGYAWMFFQTDDVIGKVLDACVCISGAALLGVRFYRWRKTRGDE